MFAFQEKVIYVLVVVLIDRCRKSMKK